MIKYLKNWLERKGIIDTPEQRTAKKAAKRKKQEETLEYIFKVPFSDFPTGWSKYKELEAAEGGTVEVYHYDSWNRKYGDIDNNYYPLESVVAEWINKKKVVVSFYGDFSYDKRIDLPFHFLKYAFHNGEWDILSCGRYMENRLRPDNNSVIWSYGDFTVEFFDEKNFHSGMRVNWRT